MDRQVSVLRAHLGLARRFRLPVLLHYAMPFQHTPAQLTVVPMTGGQLGVAAAGRF